ncbi:sensor domain-containing diguanylate cyclase [Nitratidesulfovibrio sp. HK-II]|uniref:GGDEF domain-containing protein n=1 Tax=Nitratidesulfovibrio sp. HK-II TaxID=2009266 RepID=UPI000ED650D2|nr:sensor domain-containing diguanylate cyclase [Nitratidesulfovibrio sp. HK-II]GBO97785.1 diguanylate cyclase with PAS/PAC sensor [Nitratidesulfovibrio sp. HK-II]
MSLYEQLFQRHSAVMLLVDAEAGCIIEANPAAAAFYGHPAERLCGMSIQDISTLPVAEQTARLADLCGGRVTRFVSRHRLASGEVREVEVHSVPVRLFDRTLLYSIIHDITDRARAEEALRRSEQHLEMILDGAGIGNFSWDVAGDQVACDTRWGEVLGLGRVECAPLMASWRALVHPDDLSGLDRARQRHLSGLSQRYEAEYRVQGSDGTWRWVQDTGRVVERAEDGSPLRVAGIVRDVSGRRRAEEDRRRLFSLSPDLMAIGGLDGYFREVNPAWQAVLGWSKEELLDRPWVSLVHPDDQETTAQAMQQLLRDGVLTGVENRYLCRDGSWRWISWNSAAVPDQGLIYGVGRDVTATRRAAEELRASEARLRAIASTVPGVVFQWRESLGERRFTYVSPRSREILGIEPEALQHDWQALPVHPADRTVWELSLRDAAERRGDWVFEGRLTLPDGEVRWWRGEAKPVHAGYGAGLPDGDDDGHGIVYCGIITDTTEHREAQERLRQMATTDGLTGLANRRRFLEALEHEVQRHRRYGTPLALVSIDVDRFKRVNDTWGHAVGDEVLRALAAICRAEVRDVDTVGRIGGEEFAVLLPDTAPEEAMAVAERLRYAVEAAPLLTSGGPLTVTLSLGVAASPPCDGADGLLREADRALYRAKAGGRNRVERAFDLPGACGPGGQGDEADSLLTIP